MTIDAGIMVGSTPPPSATSEHAPLAISPRNQGAPISEHENTALSQQNATAEIFEIINNAAGDLAPVFDAILDKSTSLCDAAFGILWMCVGNRLRPAALHGVPAAFAEYLASEPTHPAEPGTALGRIVAGEPSVHLRDAASDEAYRTGASVL